MLLCWHLVRPRTQTAKAPTLHSAAESSAAPRTSVLDYGNLTEDPEVGVLRRQGGVWDWDEHRATYELAAQRAMGLVGDLRSLAGLDGAIARGLFSIAASCDEDHFAVRLVDGGNAAYKWPTVPSAEESKDVVVIGAFLGARHPSEGILEPQDIPLAVRRALVIGRNVPVLIFLVSERGLLARRFQLIDAFFDRLLSSCTVLDASEDDVHLSRCVELLPPAELPGRFKDILLHCGRKPPLKQRRTLTELVKRAYASWVA